MPATIKDIARYTGLSIATISKYLNGGHVLEKNKVLIEEAIEKLNFEVNEIARGLRTNKTMTVGVLIPKLDNIFISKIISSMENYLIENGYSTIICDYQENSKLEKEKIDFLIKKRVDGLVVMPTYITGQEIKKILKRDIPIVAIDRPLKDIQSDAILVDNLEASYRAVETLIKNGHEKIGIICGPQDIYTAQERLKGYIKAHEDYNIKIKSDYIKIGDYIISTGYSKTIELLEMKNPPSALLVTNYDMTVGAIIALNEKDVKIPDELSIIGFDYLEMAKLVKPLLTIVVQPMDQIGETAAKVLLKRLKGQKDDFPKTYKLSTQLFIQNSVKNMRK